MRVIYISSHEEISEQRKKNYLNAWPIEKQLEAYSEALLGRTEKQEQMLKDFAEIREALPFYKESE